MGFCNSYIYICLYNNELGDDDLRFKSTAVAYIYYAVEGILTSFLCYIVLTYY